MRKLNLGCGLDVREGWTNVDNDPLGSWPKMADGRVVHRLDARKLDLLADCSFDMVLVNHVLHLFDYDAADDVLDECVRVLDTEGLLVIVEADILDLLRSDEYDSDVPAIMRTLIGDVEPTYEGRLLRWATWHGTRRSMWCRVSLEERLMRRGLAVSSYWETPANLMDARLREARPLGRTEESFVIVGGKA